MLRKGTANRDGVLFFDYRPTMNEPVSRIIWPALVGGEPNAIAILPLAVAETVVRLGYARAANDKDVAVWNKVAAPAKTETEPAKTDAKAENQATQAETEAASGNAQAQSDDAPAAKSEAPAQNPVAATTDTSASPRAPAGKRSNRR